MAAEGKSGPVLEAVVPVLSVDDLAAALAYYQDKLGFRVEWTWGEPQHLAGICRDRVELNLGQRGKAGPAGPSQVYFQMSGVDAYYEAREGDRVIGHVLFSPVTIEAGGAQAPALGLGLAPLAVLPAHQRRGVGAALVRAGLEACRHAGAGFVVVLGEPAYYQCFGFGRASGLGIGNEYGADDAFLVIELRPGALPPQGGLARYAPEFAELV